MIFVDPIEVIVHGAFRRSFQTGRRLAHLTRAGEKSHLTVDFEVLL